MVTNLEPKNLADSRLNTIDGGFCGRLGAGEKNEMEALWRARVKN